MRLLCFLLLIPTVTFAQTHDAHDDFAKAKVVEISNERVNDLDGQFLTEQTIQIEILHGPDAGKTFDITHSFNRREFNRQLDVGETIIAERVWRSSGDVDYFVREKYRLPWIFVLFAGFIGLAFLTGGMTGLRSLLGLVMSIVILTFFIVPQIMSGADPLLISLIGSSLIACTSIYLAHGYNRRTTIALISTIITLACSTLLALIAVRTSQLFGMGSEDVMFFSGSLEWINLRGLLLGGMVIGALGVLDDITTAQTATIDELARANPALGFRELYQRGMSVGREHVAALINTLALAYAGASMPLLLLFSMDAYHPLWVVLNSEFLAEEIVRALVGSAALLLAVPISTWFAARTFQHGKCTGIDKKHACCHH